MEQTLGGERLHAGNKMKVDLHGYQRSSHDIGYILRTTGSPGTLIPILDEIGLNEDTFDIDLDVKVLTLPTIGPLFGSFKVQVDIFSTAIRLYNRRLMLNELEIGKDMSVVKIPQIRMTADPITDFDALEDYDNSQVNPSSLLSYLGIRGIGYALVEQTRDFNALPILAYWDIYKNYYANKQEEIGAVIHTPTDTLTETVDSIVIRNGASDITLTESPTTTTAPLTTGTIIRVSYTGAVPILSEIYVYLGSILGWLTLEQIKFSVVDSGLVLTIEYDSFTYGDQTVTMWRYKDVTDLGGTIGISTFPLTNIDDMRTRIMQQDNTTFIIDDTVTTETPYRWLAEKSAGGIPNVLSSQEGLGLKTYQSDLFNNWLNAEWIDEVNNRSAVSTVGDQFTIDSLNLANKIYTMLNRIAVSGGTYNDWQRVIYDSNDFKQCSTPMYMGGLIKELAFQEVVSNASSSNESGGQPLGTLAGRGMLTKKHKGGSVYIKCKEPTILTGILSLTPRIDYSQGNRWMTGLKTIGDLHVPQLDGIGFQDSINEYRAWWSTFGNDTGTEWIQTSAGKQPAWLNYMTNVNRCYGNFAIKTKEMFMTLNRRYEVEVAGDATGIADLTTYIDPTKYNFIFAETQLDAQNFWIQVAVDMTRRSKMSAKIMPNL